MSRRVVFLCRDGLVARYVAHELNTEYELAAIVTESGRDARSRKLRRLRARTPIWKLPALALDLGALAVYGRSWERFLRRRLEGHPALEGYPDSVDRHAVDDANEPACLRVLRGLEPDVLLVLGTAILGADVLAIPREAALNIHGGLVPRYRNVHSEVWAVLEGRPEDVGTTIIHLDEGIDSGDVALRARVADYVDGRDPAGAADPPGGFFELRWRNVQLAARLARQAVRRHADGTLPREPQNDAEAGFYPTPGMGALLRLWRAKIG